MRSTKNIQALISNHATKIFEQRYPNIEIQAKEQASQ